MCEPITLSIIAGAAVVGGTLMKAAGEAKEGAAEEQAQKRNQMMAEYAGADARDRGESEAGKVRMTASRMVAQQRVAWGSSGIDASSKSAMDMAAETRMFSELDAQTIKNNAAREAWGYKVQGYEYGEKAKRAKERASGAVAGTLLGGVTSAVGIFRQGG